jgi:hypothetical protein
MMTLVAVIEDTTETHMYHVPAPTPSRKCSANIHQAQTMSTSVHMVLGGQDDLFTKMCAVPPPSAVTIHTTMLPTDAPILVGQDTTRINVSDIELT